jgi:hypothetical protein
MNRLAVLLAVAVLCSSTLAAQPQILPADPPRRMDRVVADHLVVVFSASAVASTPLPELMRRNGFVEARPLLRFEQTVTSRLGMTLGGGVSARLLSLEEQLMRTYCVRTIPNGLQPEDQASKVMSACGDVETAEPWYVAELTGMELPNDTLAKDQELLSTLRMAETWAVQSGDTSVRIGISDSGILQSHEDLKDNISVNIREVPDNGVDDDGNGYIDDYRGYNFASKDDSTAPGNTFNAREGHGTGTSGISSAVVNNVAGIAGVGGSCRFVPLKTMPDNRDGILYGYESIMYCAVNGIDVVNCSWGGFSRSCINERIVDYAFERGTIVVAAAGNHATTALFYPAAYREVLSVGVSEPDDSIAPMSGRGAFVDLMAPGNKTRTTSNSGGYGTFCCSSGASPIVAAAVGLLLSERPELRPRQAVALARRAAVSIAERNPGTWQLLPGRIDPLALVQLDPRQTPSVDCNVDTVIGPRRGRWIVGDTVAVTVLLRSHLAAIRNANLRFTSLDASIAVLDATAELEDIPEAIDSAQPVEVPVTLRCVPQRDTDTMAFIEVEISGSNALGADYGQRLLIGIVPVPHWTVFSNNTLVVSIGDNGRIGPVDPGRDMGEGILYRDECGLLYEGGIMVASGARVVDNVRGTRVTPNDHFVPIQRLLDSQMEVGIVRDDRAPDSVRLGVDVEQRVKVGLESDVNAPVLTTRVDLVNRSAVTIMDPSMAWFFDWDVGADPTRNRVDRLSATTTVIAPSDGGPVVAIAVQHISTDGVPLNIGIDNTTTYGGFSVEQKADILGGRRSHYGDENDVAVVAGMRFPGALYPGERRSLRLMLAFGTTISDALTLLQASTSQESRPSPNALPFPNPSSQWISIPIQSMEGGLATIRVFDVLGRYVDGLDATTAVPGLSWAAVDVTGLAVGPYTCIVETVYGATSRREIFQLQVVR